MIDQLIESEARLSAFLDASPFGIMVVDQTFHIVYVNKATCLVSGYSAVELIGQHMYILMPKEQRKGHVKHEKAYLENPYILDRVGERNTRPRILHRDGSQIPVELSVAPVNFEGQKLFYASIRQLEVRK